MKLLITDVGGVLLKTDEAIIYCIKEASKRLGITQGDKDACIAAFGKSIYDYIYAYLPEDQKSKTKDVQKEFEKLYPNHATHLMQVLPTADKTLKELYIQGIKIAVLSCMNENEITENIKHLKFDKFFAIFPIEKYVEKRPNPKGLQMIMKLANVTPKDTAYIGDSVNDINMAKNAGVTSIAITTGAQANSLLEKENPDFLIDSYSELINIFKP